MSLAPLGLIIATAVLLLVIWAAMRSRTRRPDKHANGWHGADSATSLGSTEGGNASPCGQGTGADCGGDGGGGD
ncbi:hypothetical protein DNK49_01375 [Azoarcus communis]|uniref:Uncharacterized protein n=1 Tax=Parazoarcus communis SWub3 = DSM 12120 TaxID=1121029 RepID=A0A323V0G7_9RHOO|nr:hypothetical protein DNK49_01375 [Azoarcus communis] [Parazoarcus communis SWub3 = DSM 12120]